MTTIIKGAATNEINQENEMYAYITIPRESLQGNADETQPYTITQNVILKTIPDGRIYVIDASNFFNEQNDSGKPQSSQSDCETVSNEKIDDPTSDKKQKQTSTKLESYKCPTCADIFDTIYLYRKHMQAHRNMKKYKCEYCLESYNVEDNFKLHMAIHAKGQPSCPLCHRKFQRIASLKAHLLIHQVDETFSCKECAAEFEKEDDYNKHLEKHASENLVLHNTNIPYVCSFCNYLFEDAAAYKEHVSYHVKIKKLVFSGKKHKRKTNINKNYPHKCEVCDKSFLKLCLLERHMRTHSGEKPFVCSFCKRGFAQKGTLQIHEAKHTGIKPYKCPFCPAKFCQKGNLRVHVERTHTAPNPGEKLYKCTQCTCIFKKVASLNAHVTRTHSSVKKSNSVENVMEKLKELEKYTLNMKNNRQQIEELLPENEEITDEYTATESIVKLTDSSINGSIRSYVVKQRTVGDIRWYICSYCAKEFKKPSDLIRHIRIHTQERPYKCKQCGMAFALKSTLVTHINIHFGKREYKCVTCSKEFTTIRTLNIHLRKHDKNNPPKQTHYKCSACNKIFNSISRANTHMSVHETKENVSGDMKNIKHNDHLRIVMKQPLLETVNGYLPVAAPKPKIPYAEMDQYKSRPFKCHLCNAAFTKPVHVKRHMLTHTGEKKFKCDICTKSFYTPYALKDHMNFHNGIKNFCCKICNKRFVTSTILKRHSINHTSKRPYICPYCKKRFKTVTLCRKHINIHKRDASIQFHALAETGELVNLEENDAAKIIDLSDTLNDNLFDLPVINDDLTVGVSSAGNLDQKLEAVAPSAVQEKKQTKKKSTAKSKASQSILKNNVNNQNGLQDLNKANLSEVIAENMPEIKGNQTIILDKSGNMSTIPIDMTNMMECNDSMNDDNLYSTIYINCEDLQSMSSNSMLTQFKLQNNDSLLLSEAGELQEPNIYFPLETTLNQTEDYPIENQVYDIFNPNLNYTFNPNISMNDLNLAGLVEKDPEQALPSINEINHKHLKTNLNMMPDGQKSHVMMDSLNLMENLVILNNEIVKTSDLNYFNNIQYSLSNSATIPLEQTIVTDENVQNLYESADFVCSFCKNMFKTLNDLQKHKCITLNITNETEEINLEENMFIDDSLKIVQDKIDNNLSITEEQIESNLENTVLVETKENDLNESLENSLKCTFCSKTFASKFNLNKHVVSHNNKVHPCSYCEKEFKKPSDLKRHVRRHTGEKPFKCEKCEKCFSLKSTLESHYRTHNPGGNREFNCEVCNLFFSSKNSLKIHKHRHTGVKPYQCQLCPAKFRTSGHRKAHLLNHMKNSTNKKHSSEMKLADLLEVFSNKNQQEDIPVEQNNLLPQIELPITQEMEPDSIEITIQDPSNENLNEAEAMQYDPVLFQQLQNGVLLLNDISEVNSIISPTLLQFDVETTDEGQVVNMETVETTNNTENQVDQFEPWINIGNDYNSRPFECDICHKRYQTKAVLKKHWKTHGLNLPFLCTKCKRGFETKDILDKHSKLHLGYRPFSCQLCTNSFSEEGSLKIHMKRLHNT